MRSAERIAFHLLKQQPADALKLADAIRDVKTRIKHCSICSNLTEEDPCGICVDSRRDQTVVCIVEQPKDLLALESAGLYHGVYHVLLGRISPLDQIEPADLTIDRFVERLAAGTIREVIMGTNPTLEGDGTALHIQNLIAAKFPRRLRYPPGQGIAHRREHRIRQQEHPGGRDQRTAEDVNQVSGFRVQGSGFRVQGSGFRAQGSGFRVQGSGFRVRILWNIPIQSAYGVKKKSSTTGSQS